MKTRIAGLVLAGVLAAGLMACGQSGTADVAGDAELKEESMQKEEDASEAGDALTESGDAKEAEDKEAADAEGTQEEKEEPMTEIEKAQAERASAAVKDVEIEKKEVPSGEAFSFVENMKVGWNLGNTLEAYSSNTPENELSTEEAWGNPLTTRKMIDEVKKAGFQTLRIPITWRNHVSKNEDGSYTVSEVWLDRVQEVVDYAYANEMYVIINTHHDIDMAEGYYPNTANYEHSEAYLTAVWTAMAERFQDYDEHLIFESMNEPRLVDSTYEWNFQASAQECKDAADCINRLNQTFVDVIRAGGGNNAERYLMVPGYDASLDGVMTDLYQLPVDSAENKIIVSVHAYTPYNFALQSPQENGSVEEFSIDSAASTKDIDSLMDRLYDKFVSKGIPVVMGEYGARDKNHNLQDRMDYHVYYIASARAAGISCCVWDNNAFSGTGENFGLFRRTVGSWLYPEIIEAIMKYA